MGTLNALYIRATGADALKAIKNRYPEAITEPTSQYFFIDFRMKFDCPEQELQSLSASLRTDVIWLKFQSAVDAFEFIHWREGTCFRRLAYGCTDERIWQRIEGVPEPWEDKAIFSLDGLQDTLECYDGDERREIEAIFRDRVLAPGNSEPMLDARETARKIAEFYRLPIWGVNDDEAPMFLSADPV